MIDARPQSIAADGDLRGAQCSRLLIRSAKLVCQSGEYVCIVRDVSVSGCRLGLFHTMPPETWVFLELANGAIYPMEKRWAENGEAGFRFTQPIEVSAFMAETSVFARRPLRLRIKAGGQIRSAGRYSPARLHDLSQAGARIETTGWLALQQPVHLTIDGLPERIGTVSWRSRYEHGLVFQQNLKLDELALQALQLQPFAAVEASAEPLVWEPALARAKA